MNEWGRVVAGSILILALTGLASAAPNLVSYQGKLKDSSGDPIGGREVVITFSFYDAESGGNQLGRGFSDADIVIPSPEGVFSTVIGDEGNEIPDSVFQGDSVYLNINVDGVDLTPRKQLTSSAFTLQARNIYVLQAGEPISAGDLVQVIDSGEVRKAGFPGKESAAVFHNARILYLAAAALTPQKILVVYDDPTTLTARLATITGNSISFGPTARIDSSAPAGTQFARNITARTIDSTRALVTYQANSEQRYAVIAQVNGTTVEFGTPIRFDETDGKNSPAPSLVLDASSGIVFYSGPPSLNELKVRELSFSGTEITLGNSHSLTGRDVGSIAAVIIDTGRFVVSFNDRTSGSSGHKAVVVDFDGTAFTLGASVFTGIGGRGQSLIPWENGAILGSSRNAAVVTVTGMSAAIGPVASFSLEQVGTSSGGAIQAIAPFGPGKVFIAFEEKGVIGEVIGNQILMGDVAPFDTASRRATSPLAIDGDRVFVAYGLDKPEGTVDGEIVGKARIFDEESFTSGLNVNRYIGVAEHNVEAGGELSVTITAGVTTQFDNLVPGRLYYVSERGLVIKGEVTAGRAITSNRLIVDY